jgi:hypothetical protein
MVSDDVPKIGNFQIFNDLFDVMLGVFALVIMHVCVLILTKLVTREVEDPRRYDASALR